MLVVSHSIFGLGTHLIVCKGKQFLSQSIALLSLPLLGQELDNLFSAAQEAVAVPPDGVGRVSELDAVRIASQASTLSVKLRV